MRRLRALFRRAKMEAELNDELRFHLEKEVEQNVRRGMSPEEARRAAMLEFGGVEMIKEECRDVRGIRPLKDLWQDVRYGVRVLLKRPGFTLVAAVTLTLGIGATSAIFSVVNSVLLRPLPYKDSERLVQVWENNLKRGWTRDTVSPLNFEDWRAQNRSFEAISAYEYEGLVMAGGESPERLTGILASSDFFRVLGVEPAIGRGFLPGEDRPGAARVAVVSNRLWQRRLGSRADAVGQPLTLNGEAYTVVGVMPPGFEFPSRGIDLWVPSLDLGRPRSDHFLFAVARLKPSVALETAQADADSVARRLSEQYPDTNGNSGITLVPLHEEVVGKARRGLLLMLGAVALLLLIACVNVANLLLSRASGRQKEIALRAALGASRARIVRQLLTESLLLGLLGCCGGALLSVWATGLLVSTSGSGIPRSQEVSVDARVLAFTLAASVLTGLLFGLAPALNFSAPDLNRTLKEGVKGVAGGRRQSRAQGALVVSEIALALVLLAGAGLLARSYARLSHVDPGFDADEVLTARISLSESRYKDKQRQSLFFRQVLERARALPGVRQAGAVSDLPFSGSRTSQSFDIEGRPLAPDELTPSADYRKVSPGYFAAMGIRLLRGRDFDERDAEGSPQVAVVNEAFARRFFGGEEALGRRLVYPDGERQVTREVVGVVGDLKHESLADEGAPEVYVPFAQQPNSWMFLAVRGDGGPAALAGPLRAAVRGVDAGEPVYSVMTMRQRLDQSIAPQRFNAMLLGAFAFAATLLAAVGVFGVLSFQVSQRRHEMGIRMALGAQRRDVLKLVVGRGLRLVVTGVTVGLAATLALTRVMSSLLFGVSATDPATLITISLGLVGVALLACYLPARRATRVDPLMALRYE